MLLETVIRCCCFKHKSSSLKLRNINISLNIDCWMFLFLIWSLDLMLYIFLYSLTGGGPFPNTWELGTSCNDGEGVGTSAPANGAESWVRVCCLFLFYAFFHRFTPFLIPLQPPCWEIFQERCTTGLARGCNFKGKHESSLEITPSSGFVENFVLWSNYISLHCLFKILVVRLLLLLISLLTPTFILWYCITFFTLS